MPDLKDISAVSHVRQDLEGQPPERVHWETRSSWLDLAAFGRTSLNILFDPSATFAALNYDAGVRSSLIFALVYGSLGQLLGRYWFTLLGIHYGILEADPVANTARFAGIVLSTPILLLIFIFFTACLVHVFLRLLFTGKSSFSATVQILAYGSGATSLLNVIPLLGSALVPVWALVLWCIGLAKAHQTSKVRTFLALLLSLVFIGLLIVGAVLVVAAMGVLEVLQGIDLRL